MKTSILILFFAVSGWTASLYSQTSEKVETASLNQYTSDSNEDKQPLYVVNGIPVSDKSVVKNLDPDNVVSVDVIKGEKARALYGESGSNGVVIIQTKNTKDLKKIDEFEKLPFQVYSIKNEGWVIQQDIFNALQVKIPSLTISNNINSLSTPAIRIRGNDAPIILLDGIRVDASILNTLNPQDIEAIHVAPSAAGTNYFLNGYRTN
ncbi:TonB-dependent receptor plug domain-containing protein [Flagellimonas meridianipacifica]|uniref:TonB-dependent receptor plug domain-containing protein n=1 Tax=Flagellimonas meridianipacifica TaxID=1080225 RepID=UPI000D068A97|nr:TonB-dependent receptor plug domain-containing protein [Allomuricauda pacifica]